MKKLDEEERYCSIEESIRESLKEIALIKKGEKKKNTLDKLWAKINEWSKDK